jgi:hypothetical protein
VGGEADATAFRTLIRSAQHDNAHVVRRGAFELLKVQSSMPSTQQSTPGAPLVGAEKQQEDFKTLNPEPNRQGLIVGAEEQQEAVDLAMTHLRKEDLRGEPLFKPNGDPLSLCTEAALTVGAFARE